MEDVRIEHRYNASDFKLGNHHENVYQMLLITNGRIRYRVGSKTYETGRGGILVLNTLEEHDLEVLEYPYERYMVRVQPDFFQNEVKYPEVIAAFIKRRRTSPTCLRCRSRSGTICMMSSWKWSGNTTPRKNTGSCTWVRTCAECSLPFIASARTL